MPFDISIPTPNGEERISIAAGSTVFFVGANGAGKTRLAAYIEDALKLGAHRISAHRALTLNPGVAKIGEEAALLGLRTGYADHRAKVAHRSGYRWGQKAATSLLDDFDFLIQALFADQARKSLETHRKVRAGDLAPAKPTKFERLVEIWERLLPHRQLHISGDDIWVSSPGTADRYTASEMSDGERAIFYMIGQTLVAADGLLLIFDEPELHVHRAVMSRLWDELEAVRQDCAFVFISHDLEFAASRVGEKFVISGYESTPRWTLREVPDDTGFDEETATLILGSRRPILFVEGDETSLDQAIYRCCFPNFTVIPRGSCAEVIGSVVAMRRNAALTRVTCAGIVDADDHAPDDIKYLEALGVVVLSVSEIENLIVLPDVSRAIAESEGYVAAEIDERLEALKKAIFDTLLSGKGREDVVARYCRRQIDRKLKRIDLGESASVAEIAAAYARATAEINVVAIADGAAGRLEVAMREVDLSLLLAWYDNKGLMALAAKHLKSLKLAHFRSWLVRVLRSDHAPAVSAAVRANLPSPEPR